jgi:hypothetical protein
LAERGGDVATLLLMMMMMRGSWAAKREVWAVEGEKGQTRDQVRRQVSKK